MIRKVYEVDPLLCPSCGGRMRIISFIEEPKVIDRIIAHLKLTFEAERPPPPRIVQKELLNNLGWRRALGMKRKFEVRDDPIDNFVFFDKGDDFHFCSAVINILAGTKRY